MLTGLVLTFMGLTRSKFGVFGALGFIVSPVGKRERRGGGKNGRREKGNRKGKVGRKKE